MMTQATSTPRAGFPILATISVAVGILTLGMMAVAALIGWRSGVRAWPGFLLWCSAPASMLGMGLAIWSLVRRDVARGMAHYGLWINGLIAVFGPPLAVAWNLVA